MNLTLLTDLDDTLFSNPLSKFMPEYLKGLGAALSSKISPKTMVPQLLSATDAMIANNDFRLTLESCFDNHFYPAIGVSKEELAPVLGDFYQNNFQKLRANTQPRPEAIAFVHSLIQQGSQVVIATNPLFPMKAMTSKLEWAELPITENPFKFVTAYETFHFAKPNPAYFAEILARLGWPPGTVAMIGNSYTDDLVPAQSLGIRTFFLSETPSPDSSLPYGNFSDCAAWIKSLIKEQDFTLNYTTLSSLLAFLRSTPAALDTMLKEMNPAAIDFQPAPHEWSIHEVICHLCDVDSDVNLPRFESILNQSASFIPAIDTDRWAEERNYRDTDFQTVWQKYLDSRERFINLIARGSTEILQQKVSHSVFGPTTVAELLKFIVIHDQNHIRQILANLDCYFHL